jgi:isoleucyl-tRNA synthetase
LSQDYNDTLNLPKTNFQMRANLAVKEPDILKFWDKQNIYKIMQSKPGDKFILHDGPPFANGKIHIGHCFNKILKDIILKYNSSIGRGIEYIPGWDCHGLPIEHQVLKKIKTKDISKVEIRNHCEEFAMKFVKSQRDEFKRLGVISDWENPYLTMSKQFEANQIKVFAEMFFNGFIYRGLKPVNWSPSSRTALAEAELDYPEHHISKSVYVKCEASKNTKSILEIDGDLHFLIWTTTPWTLPANKAISVNKDFEYGIFKYNSEFLLVELELSKKIIELTNKDLVLFKTLEGKNLENLTYLSPISKDECPILTADYVTRETGTGLVHTAPGHGIDDYTTGVKNKLEIFSPVDPAGRFTNEVSDSLAGLNVLKEGNDKVIELLRSSGHLLLVEDYEHKYPYDWRTGKPTIFRATYQWFASVDKFRELSLSEISKVKWYPPAVVNRIGNMIKERSDWCISRQRSWGLPIPVFYYIDSGEVFFNEEVMENIINIFQSEGSSSWWKYSIADLLPQKYKELANSLSKGEDTLDVWFDSGTSWKTVLIENETYPADLYLEGNDQHRGWFQSSLLTSVATNNIAPYKEVLTHGFVVDNKGQKMSKSKGNVIEPEKVINENGADILRLWVASEDYSSEIRISKNIIESIKDKYKKIRNTFKFLIGNLNDFKDESNLSFNELEEIDKWILIKFGKIKKQFLDLSKTYSFHQALNILLYFSSKELSSIYLDSQKDILYTFSKNSKERLSSQTAISIIFRELALLLSPIISFTAEEAWSERYGNSESIFNYQVTNDNYVDEKIENKWDKLLSIREPVLKEIELMREKKVLGSSLEAKVSLGVSRKDYAFYESNKDILMKALIVSEILVLESESSSLDIKVEKTGFKKCKRCWMYFSSESFSDEGFGILCSKCNNQLKKNN